MRVADAIVVSWGFTPMLVGNTLASAMNRPRTPWVSPVGLTTEVAGSRPIRQELIGCAEYITKSVTKRESSARSSDSTVSWIPSP